jgi:ubiquinone/menaquinone biosynthesis C-methylase UbiE
LQYEQSVARHYTHGSLEEVIFAALVMAGKDLDHLAPADLAPVDEFHIGGRRATTDFAAEFGVRPGTHLLDVGSGLGGASRYFAHELGCRVTGIDLTEEYVNTANVLAKRLRLEDRVDYRYGSALDLPFARETFDGAYMLHVGMNIEDKEKLFREIHNVIKHGGTFGIYDVMREKDEGGDLSFPVPWASNPDTSFVESAATYRRLLWEAGFFVQKEDNRRKSAIEFFHEMRARTPQDEKPPPLGLHILMGASASRKIANMIENLERGLIAPTVIISRVV